MIICADCKNIDIAESRWVQANDITQPHYIDDKMNPEYYCPECQGNSAVYEEEREEE